MLSATHFLNDALVGALVCGSPTTLAFGFRIAVSNINITTLQSATCQVLWESRFHGQTRQLHGRMRQFGVAAVLAGGFAFLFGAKP
jgi:hypothetical protein